MTPIDEAVKQVLQFAKSIGQRVVADFNGFIIDSKNSHDKNLDLYWHYMGRPDMDINWEQRRYEIAKAMHNVQTTRQSMALSTKRHKAVQKRQSVWLMH